MIPDTPIYELVADSYKSTSILPTPTQTRAWAEELVAIFSDGFQWKDLAAMMRLTNEFLGAFPWLSPPEKKEIIIQVLDHVIDITDTPGLPDNYSDFLFKAMIPPFVNLLITENTITILPVISGKPSTASLKQATQDLLDSFKDGFQWKDLAYVSQFVLQLVSKHHELSGKEKAAVAKEIIDFVIDETDTPYLIDAFFDSLFKQMIHPIIDEFFSIDKIADFID